MKINEIAHSRLDEVNPLNIPGVKPVVKYVGPYFDDAAKAAAKIFGAGKGTTQAELDALRASETGAANAAGGGRRPPTGERPLSTVSSDELNALLYPPRAAEPTVGSFLKRRGDPGFDPNLSKTQALPGYLQNMPPARIGTVTAPRPSPSGPRPRNATPELGRAEPELLDNPVSREIGQIRPGAETPAAAAGGEPAYTMSQLQQMRELFRTNPAAAEEQAKKWGIPWKTILGAGAAVGALQGGNALYPDTIPSAGQLIDKAVTKAATIGADPNGAGPPPGERKYDFKNNDSESGALDTKASEKSSSSSSAAADAPPPASHIDDIKDTDAYKKALKQALAGEKIDESTAALDRMVYLSRL